MPNEILLPLMLCCVAAPAAFAQQNPLAGVIDIHVHSAPDSTPRSIDAVDLARLATSRGMRGLVLKNHYEPTASLAYIVRNEVPGIEVFGGIDLNLSVGGMNPSAVEHMAAITGEYGRFVWMVPEAKQVIAVIAKHNLIMATGHASAEEGLMRSHGEGQPGSPAGIAIIPTCRART
jgi:hypothetical protein